MNPRRYLTYKPLPNRTLLQRRTWRERFLDLRHATGLTVYELAALTGLHRRNIQEIERSRPTFRPSVSTILRIRRMEAIFKEELERYLMKPHGLLGWREHRSGHLLPYGGMREYAHIWECNRTVTFGGRTFEDIQEMDDLEAIRALKCVKNVIPVFTYDQPERGAYGRVLEAASRGHFMSLAEIARVVGSNPEAQSGQPND